MLTLDVMCHWFPADCVIRETPQTQWWAGKLVATTIHSNQVASFASIYFSSWTQITWLMSVPGTERFPGWGLVVLSD